MLCTSQTTIFASVAESLVSFEFQFFRGHLAPFIPNSNYLSLLHIDWWGGGSCRPSWKSDPQDQKRET